MTNEEPRIIVSTNQKPPLSDFEKLCNDACNIMNKKALEKPSYYLNKNGIKLEPEAADALKIASIGTPFEGTIQLVSGALFPDIVADKYYGVEVKSTKSNTWSVIGSSILESTRLPDVETIYFLFGKLHAPVEFKTRRYQDCLKSIKVTHSPRYEIDMDLPIGDTIFDRMGLDYDAMRHLDDPIKPVVDYYKKNLAPGESLWWVGSSADEAAPEKLKMWRLISPEEKAYYRTLGLVLFPEIYGSGQNKFENFTMYLIVRYGIVSKSMRDIFTAGGRERIIFGTHEYIFPQVYVKLVQQKETVLKVLKDFPSEIFSDTWKIKASNNTRHRIEQWIKLIVENSNIDAASLEKMLRYYFLNEK